MRINLLTPSFVFLRRDEKLFPSVFVIEPYDVVLSQIVADLALDEMRGNFSGVFQPVRGSRRYEGGFSFLEDPDFFADGYLRRSRYDHPMFAPVVMHLCREPFAGEDRQAFGLESDSFVYDRVAAPWPVYGQVAFGNRRQALFEDFHGFLDPLGRALLGDEQRVLGVYGDDVFAIDENYRLERFLGMGEISRLSDFHDLRIRAFPVGEFFERVETSKIRPSYVYRKNAHVLRFFKESVVNGEVGEVVENLFDRVVFRKSREIRRIGFLEFAIESPLREEEYPRVPEITLLHVFFGRLQIGLFLEFGNGAGRRFACSCRLDVAVTGVRVVGEYPKSHQGFLRFRRSVEDRFFEGAGVFDGVVRRKDEREVAIVVKRARGQHDGRESVSRFWLYDEVFFGNRNPDLFPLGNAVEFVILIGYDSVIRFGARNLNRPLERVLKKGSATEFSQLDELLRVQFSRKRPEASARASGENDWE